MRIMRVSIDAPAKINLHLYIGGLRSDGYHDLTSLFVMVGLSDRLELELLPKREGICEIDGDFDFPPEENLIWKAYHRFRRVIRFEAGLRVRVVKQIPQKAGLGGGSSDAAALIKGMMLMSGDEERGDRAEADRAGAAALSLGSDVPFFLGKPAALVEGRGERITGIVPRGDTMDYELLIVIPPFEVSTAQAYGGLDEMRKLGRMKEEKVLGAEVCARHYRETSPKRWPFFNSFTPLLRRIHPLYEEIFRELKAHGAVFWEISGSGSAVFALFPPGTAADRAKAVIEKRRMRVRKTKMLASCPEAVYNTLR